MRKGKLIYCPVSNNSISFFAHQILFIGQNNDADALQIWLASPTADADGPSVYVQFAIVDDTEGTVVKNIANAIFSPSSGDGGFVDLSTIEGVGTIEAPSIDIALS